MNNLKTLTLFIEEDNDNYLGIIINNTEKRCSNNL